MASPGQPTFAAPYPGLRPFEREEAPLFYGRGTQLAAMLKILRIHHFLAVVGSSGCGKSSLVRAGLMAALDEGFLGEPDVSWRFVVTRPGDSPQRRLAEALVRAAAGSQPPNPDTVSLRQATLRTGPGGLSQAIDDCLLPENTRVLVLVDQFEEIFRFRDAQAAGPEGSKLSPDKMQNEAVAFVNQLLWTAQARNPRVYVVLTMRSDFLGDCDAFLDLPEALNRAQFLTPRLTRDELTDAITKPPKSSHFSGSVEAEVTARLLNSISASQDVLPLLQHALLRMWRLAKERDPHGSTQITREDFDRAGGFESALDQHGNELLQSLVDNQGDRAGWIAECLFTALCGTSGEGRTTRRLAKIGEIAAIANVPPEQVIPVAEHFRQAGVNFLVATPHGPLAETSTLDISHESLIRQWKKLARWVEEEAESASTYRRLLETARLWKAGDAAVWGTPDLENALAWRQREQPNEKWAERYGGNFHLSTEFLDASVAVRDQHKRELEAQKARELEMQRLRSRAIGAALAGLLAFVLAGLAWYQKHQAVSARREAISATETAMQEKRRAEIQKRKAEQAERNAQDNARKAQESATKAENARDAEASARNAAVAAQKTAEIEKERADDERRNAVKQADVARKQQERAEKSESEGRKVLFDSYVVQAESAAQNEDYATAKAVIAKSRDASLTADITAERLSTRELLARFLDIRGGSSLQANSQAGTPLRGLAVSADEQLLAIVGEKGKVMLFDRLQDAPPKLLSGHNETVTCVAFEPKSHRLITAGADRWVFSWPVEGGGRTNRWRSPGVVAALAVSHNGKLVVIGGGDFEVQAAALDGSDGLRTLPGGSTNTTCLAFSPDDRLLAGTAADGRLCLWELDWADARGRRRDKSARFLPRYVSSLLAVAFSPGGGEIATGSTDGNIQLWDRTNGIMKSVLRGHRNKVSSLAYAQNGELLVSASWDQSLRLWNPTYQTTIRVLQGHEGAVTGVAVASDSIFSCSLDESWRRWEMRENTQRPLEQSIIFPGQRPTCCALSPDAALATIGFENGQIECWSLADRTKKWTRSDAHQGKSVSRLSFSPDGARLASCGVDRALNVWDVSTGTNCLHAAVGLGGLNNVVFSPDGRSLVTGGVGGTVHLEPPSRLVPNTNEEGQVMVFDVLRQRATEVLRMPGGEALSVALSPRGDQVFAAGADGTTWRWQLGTMSLAPERILMAKGDEATWTEVSHNGQLIATAYRSGVLEVATNSAPFTVVARFLGHGNAIVRLVFSPDDQQVFTVSTDETLRAWDLHSQRQLFELRLPAAEEERTPLWDFAFLGKDTSAGEAWFAVPLTHGELVIYPLGKVYR